MKDFLSEYGFAILAAIVVILLIAMCTPVGNLIKNQIMGVVDSFANKTESKLYSLDADNTLGVAIAQIDENGKFSIKATTDSETDVLKASYRVKDQNGNWGPWTDLGNLGSGKEHSGEFTAKIENGNKIQVRVTDEGKADNLFYESNIVEYTGTSSAGGEFTPSAGGSSTGGGTTEVITNLTGCTWVGNNVIDYLSDPPQGNEYFQLNIEYNSEQYTTFYGVQNELFLDTTYFGVDRCAIFSYWDETFGWEGEKTLKIIGGTDVENSDLIAWFQANGSLTK